MKRVSIVIVTFNGLVYTKLCLTTVLANTAYPDYEVIIVDNGSTDGTTAYLRELIRQHMSLRVVLNDRNLGFAAANNQGLAMATGDVLVLLNNDTLVPYGWLMRLVEHIEDQTVGLVGPVTNRTGNEAQIEVPYRTYGEFVRFAQDYPPAHKGEPSDIRMLAMFCVAMRRDIYERVGPLDERFEVGLFEDEDYAMRIRQAGYRVVCTEDVFVHHFGQASIGKLAATGEYGELFRSNRQRFERKWGNPWEPYRRRANPTYEQLIKRIQAVVQSTLPPGSTVIVVSKGDDELRRLNGRQSWHFPQIEDGAYAGHYPSDSAEAIAHLEALRAKGGEFLLIPSTALWWLQHYTEFRNHIESHYEISVNEKDTCLIVDLQEHRKAEIDDISEYQPRSDQILGYDLSSQRVELS